MIITHDEFRVLAIAPSPKGFCYTVLEWHNTLVDWGCKRNGSIPLFNKAKELIEHYQPNILVLPDLEQSKCASHRKAFVRRLTKLAKDQNLQSKQFSNAQMMETFGVETKYALAASIAQKFPEELRSHLPPKRTAWKSQDNRMEMFSATALAVMLRMKKKNDSLLR